MSEVANVLWRRVGKCFDTDDGSLPGVEVADLSPDGVAAVYAMLRGRSRLTPESVSVEFWSRVREESLSIDSVPNAAALVATGEAEVFHICIEGLVSGVELPILGVFVWPDGVALDYRMGREWGPARVVGFFELLLDCCELDRNAVVRPADYGPPYAEEFSRAWAAHLAVAKPGDGTHETNR